MSIVLAIDAMGGDHGLPVIIPACIKFLDTKLDVSLILVGDKDGIHQYFGNNLNKYSNRLTVIHTSQIIEMDESPQLAMRNKKDSSMRIAINQIKESKAHAIISAGNTGALMAIAKYVLGTVNGIERPAIAKLLPTINGEVCMLDLGANVESTPNQLLQFAVMGAQLMYAVTHNKQPSVGLLNIGTESIKGHDNVKSASELLQKSSLNYYGNVEGDDITKGTVDVVVCDGFTGNIVLKTIEGTVKMISYFLKNAFNETTITKGMGILSYPVLNKMKQTLDPRKYNGAILLGLNGLVIKSHGSADEIAFYYALEQAYIDVNGGVVELLTNYFKQQEITLHSNNVK